MRDYPGLALELLAPHANDPAPRAMRIAAIYASLYLEEPLLHQWCGLAAFVARHISMGLEMGLGPLQRHFADGNLAIYSHIVPAFLQFRDGQPVSGRLGPGFELSRQADILARNDLAAAERVAAEALWHFAVIEQTDMCQPAYDAMGFVGRQFLRPFVLFRFGYDSAAPILKFDGRIPANLAQRLTWVKRVVSPAWEGFRRANDVQIRADLDRIRRDGGVRLSMLPERIRAA